MAEKEKIPYAGIVLAITVGAGVVLVEDTFFFGEPESGFDTTGMSAAQVPSIWDEFRHSAAENGGVVDPLDAECKVVVGESAVITTSMDPGSFVAMNSGFEEQPPIEINGLDTDGPVTCIHNGFTFLATTVEDPRVEVHDVAMDEAVCVTSEQGAVIRDVASDRDIYTQVSPPYMQSPVTEVADALTGQIILGSQFEVVATEDACYISLNPLATDRYEIVPAKQYADLTI